MNVEKKLLNKNIYLTDPKYESLESTNINLGDLVIIFYNGKKNIVISFDVVKFYPIIYDNYYYQDNTEPITITTCPYSLAVVVYYGRYRMTGEVWDNNIILEGIDRDVRIHQLSGREVTKENEQCQSNVKRLSVKLMTVRNIISYYIDCSYINVANAANMNNNVLNSIANYHESKALVYDQDVKDFAYHPKNIIYGIEYISQKINEIDQQETCVKVKHVALVSLRTLDKNPHPIHTEQIITKVKKNKSSRRIQYDYTHNGYKEYFTQMHDKLKSKGAIIIPCYYYVWLTFYPNSKIILIN